MRKDDVMQLIRAEPFRPLRLFITNGDIFDIRHPEMIAVTNGVVHLAKQGLKEDEKLEHSDVSVVVSLIHIVKVEKMPYLQYPNTQSIPEQ
jgi:hypothetical protein